MALGDPGLNTFISAGVLWALHQTGTAMSLNTSGSFIGTFSKQLSVLAGSLLRSTFTRWKCRRTWHLQTTFANWLHGPHTYHHQRIMPQTWHWTGRRTLMSRSVPSPARATSALPHPRNSFAHHPSPLLPRQTVMWQLKPYPLSQPQPYPLLLNPIPVTWHAHPVQMVSRWPVCHMPNPHPST